MRFLYEFTEGLSIALSAIRAQKLRSILTTLGIVIGITTVTIMVAAINGIEKQFDDSLSQLGADVVYVDKWKWGFTTDWWNYINRPAIREDLVEVIRDRSNYATHVSPLSQTSARATYREYSISGVAIEGANPESAIIRNVKVTQGRYYADSDYRGSKNVCIVGQDVVDGLFPVESPIGKEIRIGRNKFRVVGVLEKKGQGFGGESLDNQIMIPYSTYKKFFGVNPWRGVTIMVKIKDTNLITDAKDELTGILRTARRVDAKEPDNFSINEEASIREQMAPVKLAIYGIGIFLTALSLIVGGIGVMNIMFVSVKERTREIGIRKAIGAFRRTILLQFLIEAIIICLIGGILGLGVSFLLILLLSTVIEAFINLQTVLIAILMCVLIGLIFGLAPAWQAARANPIEALRYE